MVDGLLSRQQTWAIAGAFYVFAITVGMLIATLRDSRVLLFGICGMALAWYYHGGNIRLSYRGLGELAVAIAYGPVIVCGTYFVQTGFLTAPLIHASMVLGILVSAFLWINQFPDYRADRDAGKRNLVVRLGTNRSAVLFTVLLTTGYLWLLLTGFSYETARGMSWGLIGAAPALFAAHRLMVYSEDASKLVPAQAACLVSFVLMALGTGLGYLAYA